MDAVWHVILTSIMLSPGSGDGLPALADVASIRRIESDVNTKEGCAELANIILSIHKRSYGPQAQAFAKCELHDPDTPQPQIILSSN